MIEIIEKSLCSGCYSCENVCPKKCILMTVDTEGFWYPKVNKEECINCGLCEKRCPILNDMSNENKPKAYACYNIDTKIRKESSSGGIFTLLASRVIDMGGIVYGAAFNDEFEVEHMKVECNESLFKLRGSKYVQSRIGETYLDVKKMLTQDKLVYFSGTPCQIDGLLCYLNKEYDNLICQDIVCHGVPSPKVWKDYLSLFNSGINVVQFRNKDDGWMDYKVKIQTNQQLYSSHHNNDIYMKAFLSNICLRPSCYDCHSKSLHRNSDLTLADFWGISSIDSSMNDGIGTSLMFVNSKKGEELYVSISDNLILKEVDINEAVKYNPSAYQSATLTNRRNQFFKMYNGVNLKKIVNELTKISLTKKIKNYVYKFLS